MMHTLIIPASLKPCECALLLLRWDQCSRTSQTEGALQLRSPFQ